MKAKIEMLQEDQETIINYSKYHIGEWAELYTTDKIVMKRYEKFCSEHPDYAKIIKEDKYSMTFSIHPKIVLYPHAPRKVVLTDEQKAALADKMREIRNKKHE